MYLVTTSFSVHLRKRTLKERRCSPSSGYPTCSQADAQTCTYPRSRLPSRKNHSSPPASTKHQTCKKKNNKKNNNTRLWAAHNFIINTRYNNPVHLFTLSIIIVHTWTLTSAWYKQKHWRCVTFSGRHWTCSLWRSPRPEWRYWRGSWDREPVGNPFLCRLRRLGAPFYKTGDMEDMQMWL